jgi:tRNA threonylcarbamoyladenosine biosynthesis protein TsaE
MQIVRRCETPEATAELGRRLAGLLRPGDVVALRGELGAGKTTLVRAIAAGLGHDPALVSSPTFVIVNEYRTPHLPTVVHMDAYRLTSAEDLEALGWDRLLAGDAIVLIEWPQRVAGGLPEGHARLELSHTGPTSRRVVLDVPSPWLARPGLARLAAEHTHATHHPPEDREPTRCPVTGQWVCPDCPSWPFASENARLADLYQWMAEGYKFSRRAQESDLEAAD